MIFRKFKLISSQEWILRELGLLILAKYCSEFWKYYRIDRGSRSTIFD